MKTYEYYGSSPDGWNVSGTLKVEGNERFDYSEGWTDYTNASLSGGAPGTWRRDGNVLFFRVEKVYPPIYFPWAVWSQLSAVERGDELDFGNGWTLSLKTIPIKEIPVRNDSAKPSGGRVMPDVGRLFITGNGHFVTKVFPPGGGPYKSVWVAVDSA